MASALSRKGRYEQLNNAEKKTVIGRLRGIFLP